ncbi:MAG: putative Fe-S cluster assembly protein SufT [Thermomonas sp.]
MYSRNSEPVRFERDCAAVLVPQGDAVTLPAGTIGYITQSLGGSWTVFVEGNLMRIAGEDADAIGKEPPAPIELPEGASDEDVETLVWRQLRTCFDPEIPVNIVELGLVYSALVTTQEDGQRKVDVNMTLTAPACGMGDILVEDVRSKIELIPTVSEADVELVFDPPWNRTMMSDVARLETGML